MIFNHLYVIFMLMLEVQKGCNGDVDTCILIISVIHFTLAQPPDQRGSDSQGCTVVEFVAFETILQV